MFVNMLAYIVYNMFTIMLANMFPIMFSNMLSNILAIVLPNMLAIMFHISFYLPARSSPPTYPHRKGVDKIRGLVLRLGWSGPTL